MCKKNIINRNRNSSITTKCIALALFWFGLSQVSMAMGVGCDDAFVQLAGDELVIDVSPTGNDDTADIQCALDVAIAEGIPVVRLLPATYFISALSIENFAGTFQGRTQTGTIVSVIDNSIDCVAMNDAGQQSAAIKFIKGEPRIRFMTISADVPCITSVPLEAIVHFTGESAQAGNCKNDVVFGVVDRVTVDGTSIGNSIRTGVLVEPEGGPPGGCKDTLLGTFKLNRSIVANTFVGVATTMKSGAQVDFNFNEFRSNQHAIELFDTNQNTTITTNKFIGSISNSAYFGIWVSTNSPGAPAKTRVVVDNNKFDITALSGINQVAYGVATRQNKTVIKLSIMVTNNHFKLSGGKGYGVRLSNTSDAYVSANRFTGVAKRAIWVSTFNSATTAGVTITANTGMAGLATGDRDKIWLGQGTTQTIVGPGQGASVQDDGTDNTILPQ